MGAGPEQILVCFIWSPPDVKGVRGYSCKRPMMAPPTLLESATMTSKSDLRMRLRESRHIFVQEHKYLEISPTSSHAGPLRDLISRARAMACYHDVRSEPSVIHLAAFAQGEGIETALPWLPPMADKIAARHSPLLFRKWTLGDPLEQTALGFSQPAEIMPALNPDLILTPLVGFDRALNRLGQGAAHYDRAFQNWPDAIRVGVAWSVQEVDHLPVDPWDVPLDAILTEQDWITGPKSRVAK